LSGSVAHCVAGGLSDRLSDIFPVQRKGGIQLPLFCVDWNARASRADSSFMHRA
jgi:hypothetical protein